MSGEVASANQVRLIQWSLMRSLSTTLLRCFSNVEKSVTFCEPFMFPYYFGDDARAPRKMAPVPVPARLQTFPQVKQVYEAEYTGKSFVFGKEMPFQAIVDNYKYLPGGYRHSYLIRHPYKVLKSLQRAVAKNENTGYDHMVWDHIDYEAFYNFWVKVKDELDPNPFIFDADDFTRDPERLLKRYCSHYGIKYTDKMINWESDPNFLKEEKECFQAFFDDILSSRRVRSDPNMVDLIQHPPDMSNECVEFVKCVERNLPFYKKLYDERTSLSD